MSKPLENEICIADGIKGCISFEISNAKDLKEAQEILKKQYLKYEDVKESLKEFIYQFTPLKNSDEEIDRIRYNIIKKKAIEIFGKDLIL